MARYIDAEIVHDALQSLCSKYRISFGSQYDVFGKKLRSYRRSCPSQTLSL